MAKVSDKIDEIAGKVDGVVETLHKVDKDMALQRAAFDDHLKQDELVYQEFKRMNDILQQNTDSLKEHMLRTSMLENIMIKMDSRLNPIEIEFVRKAAVSDWIYSKLKWIGKIGAALTASVGLWMLAKEILTHLLR